MTAPSRIKGLARLSPFLALAALAASPAHAADVEADYAISLIGLNIGTANLKAKITGARYDLQMYAKMTGLVGAVTSGKGAATATGSFVNGKVSPATFAVTSQASDDSRTVRMAVAANAVQAVDITPPLEEKPDRVPVAPAHKRGVIDPMGAMLMTVSTATKVTDPAACNRTLPVFDGAARFDLVLTYSGTRKIDTKGYKGEVAVCKARYVPISGHRTQRPATKFMEQNKDMEAWFAPVGAARVLMPYRISVRTMIGTAVLEATRFTVAGASPADTGD